MFILCSLYIYQKKIKKPYDLSHGTVIFKIFFLQFSPFLSHCTHLIKVLMTWKIFSAYLKGLSKYRRIAFFFLKYLFSFWRYWRFSITQIRSVMTSYCLHLKMVKYWINDISGNIEAVFLKLGTINVHHKCNKMTPSMVLP